MMWLAQADPLGVTGSFTEYGILGLLGTLLVVVIRFAMKVVSEQKSSLETHTKNIFEFMDRHRGETTEALGEFGEKLTTSSERMASALAASHTEIVNETRRLARLIEEASFSQRFMELIRQAKANGTPLSNEEIDRLARLAAYERNSGKGG